MKLKEMLKNLVPAELAEQEEPTKAGTITIRGMKFIQITPLMAYLNKISDAMKDKESDLAVGYRKGVEAVIKKLKEMQQ